MRFAEGEAHIMQTRKRMPIIRGNAAYITLP